MVATAIIGSAVVGGIATSSAASKAAKAQTTAANNANQLLNSQYQQTRTDLAPYRDDGSADFGKYNDLLGTGSGGTGAVQSTLNSIPGYQFTQQQGLKATQNAAAARGLGVSGAALKGAASYATGLANSTYGTYANQLLSGAQLGEQAAGATANAGSTAAQAESSNLTGIGNANAAAAVAGGQAVNGVSNGLSSLYLFNALNKGTGTGLYGGAGGAAGSLGYAGGAGGGTGYNFATGGSSLFGGG